MVLFVPLKPEPCGWHCQIWLSICDVHCPPWNALGETLLFSCFLGTEHVSIVFTSWKVIWMGFWPSNTFLILPVENRFLFDAVAPLKSYCLFLSHDLTSTLSFLLFIFKSNCAFFAAVVLFHNRTILGSSVTTMPQIQHYVILKFSSSEELVHYI